MPIDFIYALNFYLLTLVISLVFFPLTTKIFTKFNDKGYMAARLLGVLVISYISWILASTKLLAFTSFNTWMILIILTAVSGYYYKTKNLFTIPNIKQIIFSELLYITFFSAMSLLRAAIPRIEGIEKFMDFAILNSILRTDYLPLQDVWYAGSTINYYYFGHFVIAILLKLTQIPASIGYNISIAFLFANVCTLTFWIARNITNSKSYGVISVILLAAGGNLDYLYKTLILNRTDYFYAEARSLIEYTINEFPSYSFLIGDLHAHIINIANVLLFVAVLYNIYLTKRLNILYSVVMGFLLGILYTTNSWDFIIYFGLMLIIIALIPIKLDSFTKQILKQFNIFTLLKTYKPLFLNIVIITFTIILLFLPFYLNFNPAVKGVGLVHGPRSPLLQIFIMFGIFFVLCSPYLILIIQKVLTILYDSKLTRMTNNALTFGFLLFTFALLLIIAPEIVYVKDIYHQTTPDYYRANTVFKVWYQAWVLLSFTSVIAIKYFHDKILKPRIPEITLFGESRFFYKSIMLMTVILVSGTYFLHSVDYLIGKKYVYQSLDGKKYLNKMGYQDENDTIDWINKNIKGQHVLLEADGESYSMQSIYSAYTGVPTVVGWTNHEFGWRNNWPVLSLRLGDIRILYTSQNEFDVKKLLNKYKIEYVVVGRFEKEKFGDDAGYTISTIAKPVYRNDSVIVYKYTT